MNIQPNYNEPESLMGLQTELGETQDQPTTTTAVSHPLDDHDVSTEVEEDKELNEEDQEEEDVSDEEEGALSQAEAEQEFPYSEAQIELGQQDYVRLINTPYIDLFSMLHRSKKSIEDLKNLKETMDSIGALSQDQFSAMVADMDAAAKQEYMESVEEFKINYPTHLSNALFSRDLVKALMDLYPHHLISSTTFISQSMVESGSLRLQEYDEMDPKPNNYNLIRKRVLATIAAYQDRLQFPMLFNKLRFPANTLETFKEFKKMGPDAAMKHIDDIFEGVFHDEHMTRFRKILTDEAVSPNLQDGDRDVIAVMVFFMTYWLSVIYEREFTSGKCAEVKTFVMNIYDSVSGIYDLPGGREYFYNLAYAMFTIIVAATSDQYTAKNITKKLSGMVDSMLQVAAKEFEAAVEKVPGAAEPETTMASGCVPDISFDMILNQLKENAEKEEDDPMANLKNQGNIDEFANLGANSVDPTVVPEEVDNRGPEDEEETAEAVEEKAEETAAPAATTKGVAN